MRNNRVDALKHNCYHYDRNNKHMSVLLAVAMSFQDENKLASPGTINVWCSHDNQHDIIL